VTRAQAIDQEINYRTLEVEVGRTLDVSCSERDDIRVFLEERSQTVEERK
jgi:hypothetical protein